MIRPLYLIRSEDPEFAFPPTIVATTEEKMMKLLTNEEFRSVFHVVEIVGARVVEVAKE